MTRSEQTMVFAGCLSGIDEDTCTSLSLVRHICHNYHDDIFESNCEEADFRLWKHVKQVVGKNVLVYSPDRYIVVSVSGH